MLFKKTFSNPDHRYVVGKVQQVKELKSYCAELFQWLLEQYGHESSECKASIDEHGVLSIETHAGIAKTRVVMAEDDSSVFARVVFVSNLNPADAKQEVPVFALTIRENDRVVSGDKPGRQWEMRYSAQGRWAQREALALSYDLLHGQLVAASQLL